MTNKNENINLANTESSVIQTTYIPLTTSDLITDYYLPSIFELQGVPQKDLLIEGVVLPLNVKNANGWGVRTENAHEVIETLKNKPVRICSREDQHGCDFKEDPFSEIGEIIDVWVEDDVIKARAIIKDRIAIQKLLDGVWKPFWSVFAVAKVDEEGWAYDIEMRSITLVTNPAWKEAKFEIIACENDNKIINYFDRVFIMSSKGGVPRHVFKYEIDKDTPWEKPNLSDFFKDKTWNDLTDAQKRYVMAHYAWSNTMPIAEKFTDLKLPHHFPGGTLSWRGCIAAKAVLRGARGGVNIPEDGKEAAMRHIDNHLKKDFGLTTSEIEAALQYFLDGEFEKLDKIFGGKNMSEEINFEKEVEKLKAEIEELKTENEELKAQLEEKEKIIASRMDKDEVEKIVKARVEAAINEYKASLEKKKLIDEYTNICASIGFEEGEIKKKVEAMQDLDIEAIREMVETMKLVASRIEQNEVKYVSESKVTDNELTVGRWDAEKKMWV